MILKAEEVRNLEDLIKGIRRFADQLDRLVYANPPSERVVISHPELKRIAAQFDRAAAIAQQAGESRFMSAARYARIARHFEVIAEAMERGAEREAQAEKRSTGAAKSRTRRPARRRASTKRSSTRKPQRRA